MPNHMVVVPGGQFGLAAATIASGSVIDDLFAMLFRVRQAELAVPYGYNNPDACDAGVAEPGVPIDIHKQVDR